MSGTITVICPHCRNRMRAAAEYLGRQGKCPGCGALIEVVAAPGESSLASIYPVGRGRRRDRVANPTEVPGWLGGSIAATLTACLYLAVLFPLGETGVGQMFTDRGYVPYAITFITCWGLAVLVLKFAAVHRQLAYADLELDFIPLNLGLQITPGTADQFLEHIQRRPRAPRQSILGRRITGALEHFKNRANVPEVQQYLASQAQLDASGVESGYTLLRSFIWCNPILGFIGTVVGISVAVRGLSGAFSQEGDLASGLQTVTMGLSTAFDTTLIGLVMTVLLLFPTEALRKREYAMLDRIEAFCNDQLLRRMSDQPEPGAGGARPDMLSSRDLPEVVRSALESAFREHERWMSELQGQLCKVGESMGEDFRAAVQRAEQELGEQERNREEQLARVSQILAAACERVCQATQTWHPDVLDELLARADRFQAAMQKLDSALAEQAQLGRALMDQQEKALQAAAGSDLASGMLALRDELAKLNQRLADLDQSKIALQPPPVQAQLLQPQVVPPEQASPRAGHAALAGEAAPGVAAPHGGLASLAPLSLAPLSADKPSARKRGLFDFLRGR